MRTIQTFRKAILKLVIFSCVLRIWKPLRSRMNGYLHWKHGMTVNIKIIPLAHSSVYLLYHLPQNDHLCPPQTLFPSWLIRTANCLRTDRMDKVIPWWPRLSHHCTFVCEYQYWHMICPMNQIVEMKIPPKWLTKIYSLFLLVLLLYWCIEWDPTGWAGYKNVWQSPVSRSLI